MHNALQVKKMLRIAAIRAWSRRTVRQTFFQSMECQSGVRSGAAPAGISAADISAYLPGSVGRGSLVTEHPREVSPLSRQGDVVRGRTHPFIRSITERPWLPPSSLLRCPMGSLCRELTLAGRQRGYFVHLLDHSGVGSCLWAGGASSAPGDYGAPGPDHVPFGSSLAAS